MFKKTTAIAAAFMMAAAMTSCADQTATPEETPDGTLIEHIKSAGLPPIPASEEEIYELGYEMCEARADSVTKQELVDMWQGVYVFELYLEEDIHQFNNILYANLCPEFL